MAKWYSSGVQVHQTPVAQMIRLLRAEMEHGDLTLGEIFEILKTSGHSVVILFLCLPFMQPLPIPGLSTPLALLISLSAILQALKKDPWFPKRYKDRDFSSPVLKKILEIAERGSDRISKWIFPRWSFFLNSNFAIWFNVLIILASATLLGLPLPIPFSNTVPALVILMQAFGKLEEDGLLICLSYVMFVLCLLFFGGLAVGAGKGLDFMGVPLPWIG